MTFFKLSVASTGKQMDRSSNGSSSCVKLFLCSNPEDSVAERRALREGVFPGLRERCRYTLGLDVRVVDPFESSDPSRWPDESTRQQLITECRDSSAGPFLLALIGHRYGTAGLPAQVEVSEFQMLLQESQQVGVGTQELERAYQRDENSVPPSYRLRHPTIKIKAEEEEGLRKVFQTSVSLCVHNGRMTPETAHSYRRSVLDADLRFALDSNHDDGIARRGLVYIHNVVNATGERQKSQVASQSEAKASSTSTLQALHLITLPESDFDFVFYKTPTDVQLLSELCDSFVPAHIACCNLPVYTTTTKCDRHYGYTIARRLSYAEALCLQVNSDLMALLNSLGSRDNSQLCDSLSREEAEQEQLCDVLSRFYDVHRPEEEKVKAYVQQRDKQCPLVVTGGPCTGKTVLLAHCAHQIQSWLPGCDPVAITHFCSLSPNTSPQQLLSSLCYQIDHKGHSQSSPEQDPSFCVSTYPVCSKPRNQSSCSPASVLDSHLQPVSSRNLPTGPKGFDLPGMGLSELKERLSCLLTLLPSPKQPLLLILDGLDQIEHGVSLAVIHSLPSPLPPGVKLILTVSSRQTAILQAIDAHYPQCSPPQKEPGSVSVQLGTPDRKARLKMLAALLSSSGRKVTSGQQALLNKALTSCCLTLYARLLHVHTCLWQSDMDETELCLPDGVHSSISALLDHCERKHGSSVVTRALSYLALSRTGLTEAELADLLSRDDRVLVPCVRLGERASSSLTFPQVDLETLLLDLRKFLIRRTVLGSDVLFWVSRHFNLVVAKRYLRTSQVRKEIHSQMADYFSGNAAVLLVKQKSEEKGVCMDRLPPSQPFVFTTSSTDAGRVNLRKVAELPHHLQLSDRCEELERGLLVSLGFHGAMLRAGLLCDLVALLEDDEGSPPFQLSRARRLLGSILSSSACLLLHSPLQLPAVMETGLLPYLQVFPVLEEYVQEIRQERRRRDTGLGAVLCPAPSSVPCVKRLRLEAAAKGVSVAEAAATECGMVAVAVDDGSVWVWRSTERDVVQLSLSCELTFAGVRSSRRFMLLSTRCNKLFLWDASGPGAFLEVQAELESHRQTPNQTGGFVACERKVFTWWRNASVVVMFDVSSEAATRFQCQSSVTCLACSSDGRYLYCGQEEGAVSVFDAEASSLLGTCSSSHRSQVTAIVLCEGRGQMASVDMMGNITLWGLAAETQPPAVIKEMLIRGESTVVCNVDYSGENDLLLVCQSRRVSLWETCEWDTMEQFLAPRDTAFTQAVLSQDGHLFVASLDACALVLAWRVDTGECVLSLEPNTQPHSLLTTASHVICVSRDGSLTAWDSEMLEAAGAAPKMGSGVREVWLHPAGAWFYTADGSEAVWRWNLDTGRPHETLLHGGPVEKLRLSLNGAHLVSLSAGEIYVWLTETGQNTLRISAGRAADILITPSCNFGVSISKGGPSRVWKVAGGSIVCSIPLHLSDAQVSPESTFLIGRHRGDLLAASLWFGSVSKRFSCGTEGSEHVVAFHALSAHPDFVVALGASGAVYTWNMAEETVCRHFQLPHAFHCRPQDFQVSADGSYALLSTDNEAVSILDLHQLRLCSVKAEGPVIKACLDRSGGYAFYISLPARLDTSCTCSLHTRPVLTAVRLTDGHGAGSVRLCKTPSALVAWAPQCVFVGFEDGSVGVFSVSGAMTDGEESTRGREGFPDELKQCPFDRAPLVRLPLATPNVTWPR